MSTIMSDVDTQQSLTHALVSDKFARAVDLSNSAWNQTLAYLNALQNVAITPVMPNVDIDMEHTPIDITTDFEARRPSPPSDESLTLREPTRPVLETLLTLEMLDFPRTTLETIRSNTLARIANELVEGSTGLNADVEQAIFDRARGRKDLNNQAKYEEAENYFASRGFELPPGALVGRLNEIIIESLREDADLNNDILVEQARLAQENSRFILEKAVSTVNEIEMNHVNSILSYNKNVIDKYVAELEAYKNELLAESTRLETILKVYLGQVEAFKAEAQVAAVEVEVQAKIVELKIKQAQITAELAIKEAEIGIEQARLLHSITLDAVKAGAQVSAQITASALSSVNASASVGFSGGASESVNYGESFSWDMTKDVPDVKYLHNIG